MSANMNLSEKGEVLNTAFGIRTTEKIREEVDDMCNYSRVIERKGIDMGRAEERAEGKKAKLTNWSLSFRTAFSLRTLP